VVQLPGTAAPLAINQTKNTIAAIKIMAGAMALLFIKTLRGGFAIKQPLMITLSGER